MKEQIEQFFTYLLTEKRVSKNTFCAYRTDVLQFACFLENKQVAFADCSITHVKEFLHALKNENISATSMARKISSLKQFYSFAEQRWQMANHGQQLTFPRVEKKLPHYLSEQEIEQLMQASQQDTSPVGVRNKVMLYLLYTTGLRITELTQLHTSSILWDSGFLQVDGKGGKQRMVPLPEPMRVLLKEYLEKYHPTLSHSKKTEYLFPIFMQVHYGPLRAKHFRGYFKTAVHQSKVAKNNLPSPVAPFTGNASFKAWC